MAAVLCSSIVYVAGAAWAAGPETQPDRRAVHPVATVAELIKAIGPDRIIELKAGLYDLSKSGRSKAEHYSWREANEGEYELLIRNCANLEIRGVEAPDNPAHIVTPHAYAFVLSFENCPDVRLSRLKIGHSPEAGYCSGGVVAMDRCRGAYIGDCVLYGCGTEGLKLKSCPEFRMSRSVIEDCTYGILSAEDCDDIRFERCIFRNNGEFHGFDLQNCNRPAFVDCDVVGNVLGGLDYPLFKTNLDDEAGRIRFTGGSIVRNSAAGLTNTAGAVILEKAKHEGNAWQAPEAVKRLRGTKTPRAEGGWIYVVPVGEATFWSISISVYGNGRNAELLKKANPGLPKLIPPDTKIVCPSDEAGAQPRRGRARD